MQVCGSALNITLNGAEGLVYNGLAQKPGVTVTVDGVELEASKYDTVYRDNIDAGEAYATVAGKDGLGFERTEAFRIAKATPIRQMAGPRTPLPCLPMPEHTTSRPASRNRATTPLRKAAY